MSNTTTRDFKIPSEYDIRVAREELRTQLAEAEKYSNEECEDFEVFFKKLWASLNEKV